MSCGEKADKGEIEMAECLKEVRAGGGRGGGGGGAPPDQLGRGFGVDWLITSVEPHPKALSRL
jgi:hypothetical protein